MAGTQKIIFWMKILSQIRCDNIQRIEKIWQYGFGKKKKCVQSETLDRGRDVIANHIVR